MASLVPDTNYSPNTTAASNAYVAAMKSFNDSLMEPVNFLNKLNTDALVQKEREEEKAIRAEDRAWKLEDRKAAKDERDRILSKETATNEALKAVLDPKAYQQAKMSAEQQAIQSTLMSLSPEDRAVAEQQIKNNYNKNESSAQWLASALGNENADQSKILSTKKNVYDIASSTPGTPEYNGRVAADRDEKMWALNAQAAKQMQLENYRANLADKKESKALAGLLAGFQTPKGKEVETGRINNQSLIDSVNKVNKAYEEKAARYGNTFKELLSENKTLGSITDQLTKLDERLADEKVKTSVLGAETSPNVSSLERNKLGLEASRDRLISSLDAKAKDEVGLRDDWQRSIREAPAFSEEVETTVRPLSKEEWVNQAVGNVGSNLTTSSFKEILNRADKMYPELDPKEKFKILEKQGTANDIKSTIESVTGKEASSNTLEGLKEELRVVTKKKPSGQSYGVGPLSLSTMLTLGIDDDDIKAIKEKAATSKISDKDLEKMIITADNKDLFPRLSGSIKNDIAGMLDILDTTKK